MDRASTDIKDMLEAAGLGLTFKKNLWMAKEPSGGDDIVTVFDTPSLPPERTLDNTNYYYFSSVQVRIRNNTYSIGMGLAYDIMESLHGRAQETWNGTLYTVIQATGEPALLGFDENDRATIIINFNLQRR